MHWLDIIVNIPLHDFGSTKLIRKLSLFYFKKSKPVTFPARRFWNYLDTIQVTHRRRTLKSPCLCITYSAFVFIEEDAFIHHIATLFDAFLCPLHISNLHSFHNNVFNFKELMTIVVKNHALINNSSGFFKEVLSSFKQLCLIIFLTATPCTRKQLRGGARDISLKAW